MHTNKTTAKVDDYGVMIFPTRLDPLFFKGNTYWVVNQDFVSVKDRDDPTFEWSFHAKTVDLIAFDSYETFMNLTKQSGFNTTIVLRTQQ